MILSSTCLWPCPCSITPLDVSTDIRSLSPHTLAHSGTLRWGVLLSTTTHKLTSSSLQALESVNYEFIKSYGLLQNKLTHPQLKIFPTMAYSAFFKNQPAFCFSYAYRYAQMISLCCSATMVLDDLFTSHPCIFRRQLRYKTATERTSVRTYRRTGCSKVSGLLGRILGYADDFTVQYPTDWKTLSLLIKEESWTRPIKPGSAGCSELSQATNYLRARDQQITVSENVPLDSMHWRERYGVLQVYTQNRT